LETARCARFILAANSLAPLRADAGFDRLFDAVSASRFAPIQIKTEIVSLCDLVNSRKPKVVCEIGSASGESLFLLSRASSELATILSIDLNYTPSKLYGFRSLKLPGQTIHLLRGDSHSPEMAARVKALSGQNPIDFLFIDGDHSYEGVAADYNQFLPLIADQGLIGFHDIIPDHGQRFGTRVNADSGGVPQFWAAIKTAYPQAVSEFVQDAEQDGFGIGVLDCRRIVL
jgi:cephalosporin hydroxylase